MSHKQSEILSEKGLINPARSPHEATFTWSAKKTQASLFLKELSQKFCTSYWAASAVHSSRPIAGSRKMKEKNFCCVIKGFYVS